VIKGKKRHVLVDTLGLVLHALVTGAGVQDRDGGVLLLRTLFGQFPFLRKLFADRAYFDKVTLTGTFASIFAADGCSHHVRHHHGETTCAAPGAPSPLDVRIAC
jgi:transposase